MAPASASNYATGNQVITDNQLCGSPYASQTGWNDRWRNDGQNSFSETCSNVEWLSQIPPPSQRPF